jgi:hypothetical protein
MVDNFDIRVSRLGVADYCSATTLFFLGGITRPGSKGIISVSVYPRHPREKCNASVRRNK